MRWWCQTSGSPVPVRGAAFCRCDVSNWAPFRRRWARVSPNRGRCRVRATSRPWTEHRPYCSSSAANAAARQSCTMCPAANSTGRNDRATNWCCVLRTIGSAECECVFWSEWNGIGCSVHFSKGQMAYLFPIRAFPYGPTTSSASKLFERMCVVLADVGWCNELCGGW